MKRTIYYFVVLLALALQQASASSMDNADDVEVIDQGEFLGDNRGGRSITTFYNRPTLLQAFPELEGLDFNFDEAVLVVIKMQRMGGSPQAYVSSEQAYYSQDDTVDSITYLNIPVTYNYYSNLQSAEQGCVANDVLNSPYLAISVPKTGYQLIRFEEKKQLVDCN